MYKYTYYRKDNGTGLIDAYPESIYLPLFSS